MHLRKIEKKLLEDIFEDDICICDVKLNYNPSCYDEIKKRLNKISDLSSDEFYEESYKIENLLRKLYEIPDINYLKKDIEEDE